MPELLSSSLDFILSKIIIPGSTYSDGMIFPEKSMSLRRASWCNKTFKEENSIMICFSVDWNVV